MDKEEATGGESKFDFPFPEEEEKTALEIGIDSDGFQGAVSTDRVALPRTRNRDGRFTIDCSRALPRRQAEARVNDLRVRSSSLLAMFDVLSCQMRRRSTGMTRINSSAVLLLQQQGINATNNDAQCRAPGAFYF